MKKRNLIIIIISAVIILLGIILFVVFGISKKPLKDLKSENVKSILIQTAPPYKQTVIDNESEIKQIIDLINQVEVYEERTVDDKAEQQVVFTLTMKDGTTKKICAYNPFVKIDDTIYRTKAEKINALSKIGKDFISVE